MSETGGTLSKRTRASGPKSKTGCQICRTRHIKCDEVKPCCSRCKTAGLDCNYGLNVFCGDDIRPGPALHWHGLISSRSRKESWYFNYFRHNTMLGLKGFHYQSGFWREMVLQFSHYSPAVLHAVLALSAHHEQIGYGSAATPAKDRLFLQQYNKSIGYLRSRKSQQPVEFTLTCCILFICLENAQGNHEIALAHLQNGLNILQDWRKKGYKTESEERFRENITQVFRRLDMQATVYLDSRQPQINATSVNGSHERDHLFQAPFRSLQDVQIALDSIIMRVLYVLTTKSNSELSRKLLLGGLASRFVQWKSAFDAFSIYKSASMQRQDLQLSVLLSLHFQTTSLMLDIKADLSSTFPKESRFQQINDLSRSLIISSSSQFAFAAETGIIAPLYFTAMNAMHLTVRQEAIDLLRLVKVKEGFWDARTAAKIAETVSKVKEAGISAATVTGGIPVLAEAHYIKCC